MNNDRTKPKVNKRSLAMEAYGKYSINGHKGLTWPFMLSGWLKRAI